MWVWMWAPAAKGTSEWTEITTEYFGSGSKAIIHHPVYSERGLVYRDEHNPTWNVDQSFKRGMKVQESISASAVAAPASPAEVTSPVEASTTSTSNSGASAHNDAAGTSQNNT